MRHARGAPQPVLSGRRILRYAFIKQPITFAGHTSLFVGSEASVLNELGPVPRIALGQSIRGNREWVLLHCTRTWQVLGLQGGVTTPSAAERRASQMYPGIDDAWIETKVTVRKAKEFERIIW
jgi:hypothetical protein